MRRLFIDLGTLLKSNFVAGIFVLIPFAVVAWLLVSLLSTLWALQDFMPASWRPETYFDSPTTVTLLNLAFTFIAALALALGISLLGWASKLYLGQKTLEWVGEWIQRIPVIRSIYSALDQLLKTLTSGSGKQFSRVVYVEYPRKGTWALAFVTGPARGMPDGNYLNIYVPTTPNPTSGFHLIVPESEVRESGLKVEEAFKTILSLGLAQSESKNHKITVGTS